MSRLWFIYQDNEQKGPFTDDEVIYYIRSKGIQAEDFAWTDGMAEWARIDHIGDFYSALNEPPSQPIDVPVNKGQKAVLPVIIAALSIVLIGGGFLVYSLITGQAEETEGIVEEVPRVAEGEGAANDLSAAAEVEDYLIAFISNHLGPLDLFVVDLEGQNMVRLTESEDSSTALSWSPDGAAIVFDQFSDDFTGNIYRLELDSGNLTMLHEPEGNFFDPAWSPDGNQIVCVGDPEGGYTTELWLMNPDGGGLTQLTDLGLFILSPAWSPDGSKLVFTVLEDTYLDSEIFTIETSGENFTRITNNGGMKSYPTWSPDGTSIIFSYGGNDEHDGDEIYIMKSDGSNKTRLTESDLFSRYPAWSPDGSKIVYSESQRIPWSSGNFPALHIMNADGGNKNRITEGLSFEKRAAWSPLKLNINNLGEVIARDALDPDILLGEWQGEYEGVTIEYNFSAEEMEYTIPGGSSIREYRVIPYFSVLNLDFFNIFSEAWEGYGQVEIIDQNNIIIRDFYLFDTFSDDYMEFYIEVPCVRVEGN